MANNAPPKQNYTPVSVEGVVEVNGRFGGWSPIDSLRGFFTIDSQMEQGNHFMDRSRHLLEKHLQLMEPEDQTTIHDSFAEARTIKNELRAPDLNGSQLQVLLRAKRYKRVSKKMYAIVKEASDRVLDGRIMNQFSGLKKPPGGGLGSGFGTDTALSNPFTDGHAVSTLSDINVNNLDRVETSTYQNETTDQAAVVAHLISQDKSVQHIVTTGSTEALLGNTTGRGDSQSTTSAPAHISVHRDDGSSPRLITAYVSDQRVEEQVEMRTLNSVALDGLQGTSEGDRSQAVVGATPCLAEGSNNIRSRKFRLKLGRR